MHRLRQILKKVLPDRFVDWYRRRRATRQYLEALSYELIERETRLDYLEGRIAARRDGFYQRIVSDVLERTEIILQELDRRIEGVSARTANRLSSVEDQMVALREELAKLREAVERTSPNGETAGAAKAAEEPAPSKAAQA